MFTDIQSICERFWNDLVSRPAGPMTFRFILQPVMAGIQAVRDGIKDGRTGRTPYFWMVLFDPQKRTPALREGLQSTSRVVILGLVTDTIYQFIEFHAFYPMEAVFLTFCIAFVPYLLIRGPAARITRRRLLRKPANPPLRGSK